MKKYIFAGVAVVLAALIAVGGFFMWGQVNDGSTEVENVAAVAKSDGVIIVGLDPTYPPMELLNDKGEFNGYDVDLMKAVFANVGVKYKVLAIKWSDKEKLIESGEIDLIWSGFGYSDERAKMYELSEVYLPSKELIVVTSDSEINDKSQLADKVVGVETGGTGIAKVGKFSKENSAGPVAAIKESGTTPEVLVSLLRGEVDAIVATDIVVDYYIANNPGEFRSMAFRENQGLVVAAKKGNAIIAKINKGIENVIESGEEAKIREKWLGKK